MVWGIFKKDAISESYEKMKSEELKGKQHKLDKNKNGKLDADDFEKLRNEENVEEGWDDMLKYAKEKNGPQPNGGAGKKQGTRYGGGKQKDDESEKRKEKNEAYDESNLEQIDEDEWYDGSDMLGEAQARYSTSYQFTHKPGDEESEKKLADLKKSVKGTGKRVVLQGRLGKNNPNAHKYSKNAPQGIFVNGKRTNSDVSGKSGAHTHQRIQKADAAHHDVYVYDKSDVQYDPNTVIAEKITLDKDGNKIGGGSGSDLIKDKDWKKFKPSTVPTSKLAKEEVEQIDELSIGALKNYIKGAKSDKKFQADTQNTAMRKDDHMMASDAAEKVAKRKEGIKAAKAKLNKEGLDLFSEKEIDMLINEVLSKDASAGTWIKDFIKSDAPQFVGKSQEKRKQMALGAYYAAQKKESTDYESFLVLDEEKQADIVKMGAKEIKHANMKDKQDDQEVMATHSGTEQQYVDAHSVNVTDDPTQRKFDAGTGKIGTATAPKGKGPASYDSKEKLGNQGIKEAIYKTAAGEEIDTTPEQKKTKNEKANPVNGKKVAGDDNDHC